MKAKTRKILTGVTALTLTAAISAGGTFAFLTKFTEKRANNFTFASGDMDAKLIEPKWDGVIDYEDGDIPVYDYIDDDDDPDTPDVPVYGYEDGDPEKPVTDKKDRNKPGVTRPKKADGEPPYGVEAGQNMIPGQIAPKNPYIVNTGNMDEWVAAKVTFVYADGSDEFGKTPGAKLTTTDFALVTAAMQIDWPETYSGDSTYTEPENDAPYTSKGWYYINPTEGLDKNGNNYKSEMIFYYDKIITANGDETAPIFNTVTLSKDAGTEQIEALEAIGGFAIYIEGYAVQYSAFSNGYEWVKANDGANKAVFVSDGKSGKIADVSGTGITKAGKLASQASD